MVYYGLYTKFTMVYYGLLSTIHSWTIVHTYPHQYLWVYSPKFHHGGYPKSGKVLGENDDNPLVVRNSNGSM